MRGLELLKPRVRALAEKLLAECKSKMIDVIITDTYRTGKEQNDLYKIGRSRKGNIVTNSKAGHSFHNYGLAFDFCPVKSGKLAWDRSLAKKIGKIGESIGLEWGGSWRNFKDYLHFQYSAGYQINDLLHDRVDWKKFD